MSNSTSPLPEGILQSQTDVLGPGIAGLLIQGLLAGLVLAQFGRWFSAPERNDSAAFSALVVFVTMAGLCVFQLENLKPTFCLTDYRCYKCADGDSFCI
jgi:hypothetical protein